MHGWKNPFEDHTENCSTVCYGYDHSFITYLELGAALGMCIDRVPRLNTEMKLCRHAYRECIAQFFISYTAIYGRLAK